ncbi:hypothetical protein FACS1894166_00890 [Bacilli bacterium]|nr:hypothetical protein FACS1894166_00890 [Bacilli bacterium]
MFSYEDLAEVPPLQSMRMPETTDPKMICRTPKAICDLVPLRALPLRTKNMIAAAKNPHIMITTGTQAIIKSPVLEYPTLTKSEAAQATHPIIAIAPMAYATTATIENAQAIVRNTLCELFFSAILPLFLIIQTILNDPIFYFKSPPSHGY